MHEAHQQNQEPDEAGPSRRSVLWTAGAAGAAGLGLAEIGRAHV